MNTIGTFSPGVFEIRSHDQKAAYGDWLVGKVLLFSYHLNVMVADDNKFELRKARTW